jgi:hypothetical protein
MIADNSHIIFDGFMKIGRGLYVENWNKSEQDKEAVKKFIIKSVCCQEILCMLYGVFVYRKEIMSINEMPVELLDDLESEAKTWHPSAEGKELEKLMKCIWAMNHLLTIE